VRGFFFTVFLTWIASTVLWATNGRLGSELIYDIWYLAIAVLIGGGIVGLVGSRSLRASHGSLLKKLVALGFVASLAGPLTVRALQGS
jgi:hypothetical protein